MVKFSIVSPAIPSSLMVTATSRPAADDIKMSDDTTRKSSTVKNKYNVACQQCHNTASNKLFLPLAVPEIPRIRSRGFLSEIVLAGLSNLSRKL